MRGVETINLSLFLLPIFLTGFNRHKSLSPPARRNYKNWDKHRVPMSQMFAARGCDLRITLIRMASTFPERKDELRLACKTPTEPRNLKVGIGKRQTTAVHIGEPI